MNFSLLTKPIFKISDSLDEGPFKLINSTYFLYSESSIIKCINIKTNKNAFSIEEEYFMEPYFGLVNNLKLLAKQDYSKVIIYQIDKTISGYKKIKVLNIKGFEIARSLYKNGYIIGGDSISIYNFKDELEYNISTKYNFSGFDYHTIAPFEIQLENKMNNLLVLPMGDETNICLRKNLKKVMAINSCISDALDMEDGNIILASQEKLILVNLNNYKIEYEIECPQVEEKLKYWDVHTFSEIFKYKDNTITTISGMNDQNGDDYLISFWNYNSDKSNNKIELIQSLVFQDYALMLDNEKLLIMSNDSIIRVNIKEIKGKDKNIIKTTTITDYKKKEEKSGNKSKKGKK